ncbi:MAG: ATP-binding protein [Dysgonamonadaceae bacterium]|jgi:predicted AAA+ superfamily ATPase|nr:ATP-binding protein [Dysgonamonadaceae bacterium]
MIRQERIADIIDSQWMDFLKEDTGYEREILGNIPVAQSFTTIITGIRRAGKSTLLLQLLKQKYEKAIYLRFDDIRLSGFETDDFTRLLNEIEKQGTQVLFFDEIQLINGWELFVNHLLREHYTVFITGSNASMLSAEMGTHLTGRHLSVELFPFSYTEFIHFHGMENNAEAVETYIRVGGIPEYVKTAIPSILNTLIDDILWRDIAIRHGVRDIASLRQLTVFLLTNISNTVTANKLVGMFGIKSPSTFLEYFSYLRDAYLFDFVPIFSHSLKVQARNPKKVYTMDLGLYTENAISTSENSGRRLENLIFLHLRRRHKNIFYFQGKGGCDFIVLEKNAVAKAIQVCLNVTDDNFEREYNGLKEAMKSFDLPYGQLITLNQNDRFENNGMTIELVPASVFLSE